MNLLSVILLVVSGSSFSQVPDFGVERQIEKMAQLDFLVGEWKGQGWYEYIPGQRMEVDSRETVTKKAGGVALSIDGHHTLKGQPGRVVHNAYALVWYDVQNKVHRMRAIVASGANMEFDLIVENENYEWAMEVPGLAKTRYRMHLSGDGEWVEVGEITQDGREWRQIFEMRLKKEG